MLSVMTTREQLIDQVAKLSEEDARVLLEVARRLARATGATATSAGPSGAEDASRQHPERFGALAGSVEFLGDVEAPVAPGEWTSDEGNAGS